MSGEATAGEQAAVDDRAWDLPLADRTLAEVVRRRARLVPDRCYLRFEHQRFSFADADDVSDRIAAGLAALGVGHGSHVALLLGNRPEIVWLYLALSKLGAVAVPLNTAVKGELLAYYLDHSDATMLVVEQRLVDRFRTAERQCPAVTAVVVVPDDDAAALPDDTSRTYVDYRTVATGPRADITTTVRFSDTFALIYTSGTTGPSKANVWPQCVAVEYAMARIEHLDYRADDVLYTALPLFHGNALFGACIPALVRGCTFALSPRFSARAFWDDVRFHRATKCNLLGAMASILFKAPPDPGDRDHPLRQCTGVPVPDFARDFENRFGVTFTSVYALTDFGLATVRGEDAPSQKLLSAGRARAGVQVAILDDDDLPLPPNEPGEICLRNTVPWIAATGYYKMPEETVRATRNLWFHTGDRGLLDEEGYLYFVDRKKDAIRRRGENISSWEVEQILGRHPDVAEVAAFAVRSELGEDEVMVAVVLTPGSACNEADLVHFASANMAYFMVPRYVELVTELPRNEALKVQKAFLRQSASERLAAIWDREQAGLVIER